MGNSKPIKGQIKEFKPMTPEERKEQATRAYLQKRESIATGVLFNLMHNSEAWRTSEADEMAEFAISVADKMIEKLYFTKEDE